MKEKIIQRSVIAAIGLAISGVGVGMFIFASLGADPASVFQLGVANQLNISYGTASAGMNIVILTIVFFINRKYINISSFLAIFLIGYTADFVSLMLGRVIIGELVLAWRLLILAVGCVIMAFGIPIYIRANLGVGAVDLVSELISDSSKFSYRIVRIACDSFFLIVGFILGGPVGIGTACAVILTGPLVQFFRPMVNKNVDKILGGYYE